MGSLANWGAVAGAAKGWNEGSKEQEKSKQHKLDQEREERLATLAHNRTVTREETRYKRDKEAATQSQTHAQGMQEDRQTQQTSERESTQDYDAGESALDREGRANVADINQAGQTARSDTSKWTYKQQQPTSAIDPESGAITETQGNLTLTDPETNLTYVQKGNVFRYADDKAPMRPPAERERAEKKLRDNLSSDNIRAYIDKFGYLPAFVFQEMKASGAAVEADAPPQ